MMEITTGLLGYIVVGEFVAICMLIYVVCELCKENKKRKAGEEEMLEIVKWAFSRRIRIRHLCYDDC